MSTVPTPRVQDYPQPGWPWLAVFLGFVTFKYLQGGFRFAVLGTIRFEFIVGTLLVVVAVFKYSKLKRVPTALTGWIIAWLAIMLIMVPLSIHPLISWEVFLERVLKFAMMTLFIATFVTSPTALRWFLGVYLLSFLKMGQEGVFGILTGSLIWDNQGTPRLHGPTPSYAHPNSFAGTQLATVPFLYSLLPLVPLWMKVVVIVQAVIALWITIYSGSRTAYVAVLAWVMFLTIRAKSKVRAVLVIVTIAAAVFPLIPSEYFERFETIVDQQDKEGASIDLRRQIMSDAWAIFIDNPQGLGAGAFSAERQRRFGRTQDTHNLYLEIGTNFGVQGLIIFAFLITSMLGTLRRVMKDTQRQLEVLDNAQRRPDAPAADQAQLDKHKADVRLIAGVASAVIGFIFIRLALGLFGHDLYEIYWWFALGLTLALLNMTAHARARTAALTGDAMVVDAGGASRIRAPVGVAQPGMVRRLFKQ